MSKKNTKTNIHNQINKTNAFEYFSRLNIEDLNYQFIKLLESINIKAKLYKINDFIFLLIYKNSQVKSIYYITNKEKICFDNLKTIHNYFEKIGEVYKVYNYKHISINGYDDSNGNIWIMEKFNMYLDDFTFIEKILHKDLYIDDIELMPHNKYTYRKISNMLKTQNKVCAIQATGTGKSFLAAKCCLDYKNENKIILSSSYYILEQFKLKFDFLKEKTIFLHYGKLSSDNENIYKEIKNFNPKLIILDEFHRAGANEWFKGIKRLLNMFPNAKILGTSATPIRYLDNFRDMSEELFDKNIANQITLFDAIVNKILPMPKYIKALFEIESETNKRLKKIEDYSSQKKSKLLINSLLNEYNTKFDAFSILKKYITNERKFVVFCKDSKHLEEMVPIVENWFNKISKDIPVEIYKVSSQYNNSTIELNDFINSNNDSFKLLFAIDKMNEGVHISSLDGLIFLRNTVSPIIYLQQMGRCLQTDKNKTPIIFDFVNNFSNIQSINFKNDIVDNFNQINNERRENGLELYKDDNLDELISCIHDETIDVLEMLKEIDESLSTDWEYKFLNLKEFYDINGHCNLPKDNKYKKLNYWCDNQRNLFKKEKLSKERIEKLNSINFIWEKFNHIWEEQYKKLIQYKEKNNTTIIPKTYFDYQLYTWTITQRILKKQNKLNEYRVNKLNDINFIWDVDEYQWEKQYQQVLEYYKINKNFDIKLSDSTKSIVKWMQTQRLDYKNNKIKPHRKDKLDKINFIWNTRENLWINQYNQLLNFKLKNGHCNVKVSSNDKKLYKWIISQRLSKKEGKLDNYKIKLLNDIGFIWNSRDSEWEEQFNKIKNFYLCNNHFLLEDNDIDKSLVLWASKQRLDYKNNKLNEDKIKKLNSISFPWNLLDYKWELQYTKLINFKNSFGTTKIPPTYQDSQLYQWVKQQRKNLKNNKLKQERIELLQKINFE